MQKGPEIRIIGDVNLEKMEQIRDEFRQALFCQADAMHPQERNTLIKLEYPKSAQELALINFANERISTLREEAGLDSYIIPAQNYHIVPPDFYDQITKGVVGAASLIRKQAAFFNGLTFRKNPVLFGAATFHETLHLMAHLSLEVHKNGDTLTKTAYREGVTAHSPHNSNYHHHFIGLHEAIVAETEKRFIWPMLDLPELAKEKEWLLSAEAMDLKRKVSGRMKMPESDLIWVDKEAGNDWESVSYAQQRKVLNYVCDEIHEQFPDQYQNSDEVYKNFLNAHFTGRLLPIARAVESTFGAGSFRLLGNMSVEPGSGVLHLESMKKARARHMRPFKHPML